MYLNVLIKALNNMSFVVKTTEYKIKTVKGLIWFSPYLAPCLHKFLKSVITGSGGCIGYKINKQILWGIYVSRLIFI